MNIIFSIISIRYFCMFKLIDINNESVTDSPVSFIFIPEKGPYKGNSFKGYMKICANPFCECSEIQCIVKYSNNPNDLSNEKNRYIFYIDALEKKCIEREIKSSAFPDNNKFKKAFISELTNENWEDLENNFFSFKCSLTENFDVEDSKYNINFPKSAIEDEGLMISYHEIFPYAKDYSFEYEEIEYLIDDQYCINPKCNCTEVNLILISLDNHTKQVHIRYDYKQQFYLEMKNSLKSSLNLKILFIKIKETIPDINNILRKRHEVFRALYRNSKKQSRLSRNTVSRKKVGRNVPCPCGSGKKYKKCCGR